MPVCAQHLLASEVCLSYDPATGEGRTHDIKDRAYPLGRVYYGTADVASRRQQDRSVYVLDWKTGRGAVPAAHVNPQLGMLALALARVHGVDRATVALGIIDERGHVAWDVAALDGWALDGWEERLKRLATLLADDPGDPRPGAQCRNCRCFDFCPATTALVRQLAAAPGDVAAAFGAMLTVESAAVAYGKLKQIDALTKALHTALMDYARERPITLPNGYVYGLCESSLEHLDGDVTHRVLAALHGIEIADAACQVKRTVTKAALRDALRPHAHDGHTIAALEREAIHAVREAGGATTKRSTTVKEHKP